MALVTTDALILQAFGYSETSKILRLLTRTHGVRSVIARGALRPKSRYGGVLEPFTEGVATLYLKDTRELQTLGGFDLTRSRQSLGRDLHRFGGASLLAEVALRTASEESQPRLFERVRQALDRIETAAPEQVEAMTLAQAWRLVGELGFAPSLDRCIGCDRALEATEDAFFDYPAGAVRCARCGAGGGHGLPGHARTALRQMGRGEAPPALERTAAHWQLLTRFLEHHVLEGASLRSLGFLADLGAQPV